jgi:YcxB-like protein
MNLLDGTIHDCRTKLASRGERVRQSSMENSRVVVDVDLRPNDVYTPFQWNRSNCARWVASALLCYMLYDMYKSSSATISSFEAGNSILAIIALLVFFILLGLLLFPYLRVRAMFRKSPALTRTRRYTFSTAGLTIHSEDATSDCKWSLFQRVVETQRVFVFSQTSHGGTYVPKRCFASPEDMARLRELIRQNMSGKFKLRPA